MTDLSDMLRHAGEAPRVLVRFPNWVGDAVMALPGLAAIRASMPGAVIDVLARPWVADVVSLSGHVDSVVPYMKDGRHRGPLGKLRLAGELRGRYDAAVLFQNAIEAALITAAARVPLRGGYDTDRRAFLLTHPVHCPDRKGGGRHQVHYYMDLVRSLGFAVEVEAVPVLKPPAPEGRRQGYVVLAPGAAYGPAKMWPEENYTELGRRLAAEGRQILVIGSKSEADVCGRVASGIGAGAEDLAGKTGLAEAAGILAAASLAVCNDSGLMHVAAAVGVPLVAIFGSTEPGATGPLSHKAVVMQGEAPCAPCFKRECSENLECYAGITVERVFAEGIRIAGEGP